MRYAGTGAALAALVVCAGCATTSTVQSVDISKDITAKQRDGAYLTYAVAKSLIVIQISSAAATAGAAPAGGGKTATSSPSGGAATPPTGTGAATPTPAQTWTFTGALTSGDAKPDQAKADPARPAAVDTSLCATLGRDYQASQTVFGQLIDSYGKLGLRLAQMGAGAPAKVGTGDAAVTDSPASLANDVAAYNNLLVAAHPQLDHAKATYALLSAYCAPSVKVSIQQQVTPDWTQTFALKGHHDDLYADVINLKADANGLFTTTSAATTDETAAIATGIASTIGEFAGLAAGSPIGTAQVLSRNFSTKRTPCPKADPASPLSASLAALCAASPGTAAAAAALAVLPQLPTPPALPPAPDATGLPVTLVVDLADLVSPSLAGPCPDPSAPPPAAPPQVDEVASARDNVDGCLAAAHAARVSALESREAVDPAAEATAAKTAQDDFAHAAGWAARARNAAETLNNVAPPRTGDTRPPPRPLPVYEPPPTLAAARQAARRASAELVLARYGVAVELSCSPRPEGADWDPAIPEGQSAAATGGVYDGLIVSASRACRVDARQAATSEPLANADLWVQDSRYLTRLPMRRAFLVTRTVEYDFQNGSATGVSDNRPSSAQALVALPGNVVAALIGGVTSAITSRNTVTNDQTAAITAKVNLLNAQTQYLTAQKALQAASASPAN
ncbi:MAG TPA: hypothetical protein VGG29_20520 [Caulobacteraceae bacterium]|jgi:hypothetical protein